MNLQFPYLSRVGTKDGVENDRSVEGDVLVEKVLDER